jgi:hypothetical protein
MRVFRRAAALTLAIAFVLAGTQPAVAAPPSNDTPSGATSIAPLPFDDSIAIDEATTDALDETLNAECGAPATEGSVWYRFDATADGGLIFDVADSSFSAGALVTAGDPANGDVITCGPGAVAFAVEAGQSYSIMAFSDTPGVTTGTLVVHAEAAPPPPEIDVTVDPIGTFDPKTGSATVSGTFECSGEQVAFSFIDVALTQTVGRRFEIHGFGSIDAVCDGATHPWTIEVIPDNGSFAGGHALAVTFAVACGPVPVRRGLRGTHGPAATALAASRTAKRPCSRPAAGAFAVAGACRLHARRPRGGLVLVREHS